MFTVVARPHPDHALGKKGEVVPLSITLSLQPLGVALLSLCLISEASSYEGWTSGARRKHWIEFCGHVLNTAPFKNEAEAKENLLPEDLYTPQHYYLTLGRLPGQSFFPYQRLWIKGDPQVLQKLTLTERASEAIRLSGVLREHAPNVGILELLQVEPLGMQSAENPDRSCELTMQQVSLWEAP